MSGWGPMLLIYLKTTGVLILAGAGAAVGMMAAGLCFYILSIWRNEPDLTRQVERAASTNPVGDDEP